MIRETRIPHLPYYIDMTDSEDDIHMDYLHRNGYKEYDLSDYGYKPEGHSYYEGLPDGNWRIYLRNEEDAVRSLTAIGRI
jgi:hypothetical protein